MTAAAMRCRKSQMQRGDGVSMGLSQEDTAPGFTTQWGLWRDGSPRLSSLQESSELAIGELTCKHCQFFSGPSQLHEQ